MGIFGDWIRGAGAVHDQQKFDAACRRMARAIRAGEAWAEADEHAARAAGKRLGIERFIRKG